MSQAPSSIAAIAALWVTALTLGCASPRPRPWVCALAGSVAGAAAGAGVQAGRDQSGGDIAAGAAVGAAGAALIGWVVCELVGEEKEVEAVVEPPVEPAPEPAPPAPEPVVRERIVLRGVTFGFDETEPDAADAVVLDEAVRQLERLPELGVRIEGHTDGSGPAEYNQTLSERRAEAVKRYLEEQGIPAARLSAVGRGESQPIADDATAEGRARNRRVELQVIEP